MIDLRDGTTLHVHRAIICQNKFFNAACAHGFKVSLTAIASVIYPYLVGQESVNRRIDLSHDEPASLRAALAWVYGYSFLEAVELMKLKESLNGYLNIYIVADKYGLSDLLDEVATGMGDELLARFEKNNYDEAIWQAIQRIYELEVDNVEHSRHRPTRGEKVNPYFKHATCHLKHLNKTRPPCHVDDVKRIQLRRHPRVVSASCFVNIFLRCAVNVLLSFGQLHHQEISRYANYTSKDLS